MTAKGYAYLVYDVSEDEVSEDDTTDDDTTEGTHLTTHGEYFDSIIIDGEEIELSEGDIYHSWSSAGRKIVYVKLKEDLESAEKMFFKGSNVGSSTSNDIPLVGISSNLFARLTQCTSFAATFYNCTSLESIPEGLFDSCTAVTDFSCCFYNCTSLDDAVVYIGSEVVTNVEYFASNVTNMTVYVIEDSNTYTVFSNSSSAHVTVKTYTK